MSDSQSPVTDAEIQWTESQSTNGKPFEVGVKAGDVIEREGTTDATDATEASDDLVTANSNKDTKVSWQVTGDVWKETEGEVADVISRYSLHINHGSFIYDWKLEFTNKMDTCFRFVDETGDVYEVTTHRAGDHYVRYNSAQPAIKAVRY